MASEQWHGGKGSKRRSGDQKKYAEAWDRIWGNKDDKAKRKDNKSNNKS